MNRYRFIIFFVFLLPLCSNAAEDDRTIQLLKKLTEAHGASGFEGPVRTILKEEWKPFFFSLQTDGMGNLIGSNPSNDNEKKLKVLIMAHMDEVGFLVRDITPNGFIYLQHVGDWLDPVLLAKKWIISTPKGPVVGYSGAESIHALPEGTTAATPSQRKIFIDVGAKSKEEAMNMGIRPGLPITPDGGFTVLEGGTRYLTKALDDRALLAVMTEMLPQLQSLDLPVEVVFAATVQEEVGMRGSTIVFQQTKPDIVINLDVGIARDFPLHFSEGTTEPVLGKGPTVFVFDWSMIPNDNFVNYVTENATKAGIPFQYELEGNYGEDGCNLQRSGNGITCINLGLPVRYAHSHAGVMDRTDYDNMVKLLVNLIKELTPQKIAEMHPQHEKEGKSEK